MDVESHLAGLPPGSVLGHFEIQKTIGAGGFGVVFRARDLRLGRDVALKVLNKDRFANPTARKRFHREARLAASISHPNIATIHEVDEHRGNLFIAMELVEGEDLKSRIHKGPLSVQEIAAIGSQACAALEAAHARGVIHRDIKPANIMVTPTGQVKLLDFGLAKPLSDEKDRPTKELPTPFRFSGSSALNDEHRPQAGSTATGLAVGTPSYMAPEQARGHPIDGRADLFSLAIVLYESACGELPFRGRSEPELLEAICVQQPRPIHESHPEVPTAFSQLITKCLSKSPDERPRSAEVLGRALAEFAGPRRSPLERLRAGIRHLAAGKIATAACILILAAAAWGVTNFFLDEPNVGFNDGVPHRVLLAGFENATDDPDFDGTLETVLSAQLDQSSKFVVVPPERVGDLLRQMGLDEERGTLELDVARQAALRGRVPVLVTARISQLGGEYLITGSLWNVPENERLSTYEQRARGKDAVLDAVDRVASAMRLSLGGAAASLEAPEAPAEMWTSQSWEALELYASALKRNHADDVSGSIALLEHAIALDPTFAMAHALLGRTYDAFGREAEAIEALERAVDMLDRLTPKEQGFVRAFYYQATSQGEEMLAALESLASLYPHDPVVLRSLGHAFVVVGDFRSAASATRRAVELAPEWLVLRYNLANDYILADDLELAAEALHELEDIDSESRYLEYSWGYWHLVQGRIDDAIPYFRAYASSSDPVRRSRGYHHLVNAHLLAGQFATAGDLLRERIAFSKSRRQGSVEAESLLLLSRLALELDRMRQARSGALEALEAPLAADELRLAGEILARAGDPESAADVLARLREGTEFSMRQRLVEELEAEIALAEGRVDEAVGRLRRAVDLTVMPSWSEPLARALLAAGDDEAALSEYARIVERKNAVIMTVPFGPAIYADALFRMAELQERSGATREAMERFQEYAQLRSGADDGISEVHAARSRVAGLR